MALFWLPQASLGLPFGCPVTKIDPNNYQNEPQNPRESITNEAKKGEDKQSREEPRRDAAQRYAEGLQRDAARGRKQRKDDAEIGAETQRMNPYALYTPLPPARSGYIAAGN